jgi:hypothetical protein
VERRQASALCEARAAPAGAAFDDASVGVLLPFIFSVRSFVRTPCLIVSNPADPLLD